MNKLFGDYVHWNRMTEDMQIFLSSMSFKCNAMDKDYFNNNHEILSVKTLEIMYDYCQVIDNIINPVAPETGGNISVNEYNMLMLCLDYLTQQETVNKLYDAFKALYDTKDGSENEGDE